ncbi:hypothetical protein [Bacillus cereus]
MGRYRNNHPIGGYRNSVGDASGIFSRHGRTSERFAEEIDAQLVG